MECVSFSQVIKIAPKLDDNPALRTSRREHMNLHSGSFVPLTVQIYFSGKSPGIQSLANLAGKLSRKGARWVSDFSAPTASSSAVIFRA